MPWQGLFSSYTDNPVLWISFATFLFKTFIQILQTLSSTFRIIRTVPTFRERLIAKFVKKTGTS